MEPDDSKVRQRTMTFARRSDSSDYVRSRWPFLPPHIREAIVTLVDAGLAASMQGDLRHEDSDDEQ